MIDNFDACLAVVLRNEGGWSDDPQDPGGATESGITLETYSEWLGRPATDAELENLSSAVEAIYHDLYWQKVCGDLLPKGIDLMTFDIAVNSGPRRATEIMQEALGVTADGIIGARTRAVLAEAQALAVVASMRTLREKFYRSLAGFGHDGNGWLARNNRTSAIAVGMVA